MAEQTQARRAGSGEAATAQLAIVEWTEPLQASATLGARQPHPGQETQDVDACGGHRQVGRVTAQVASHANEHLVTLVEAKAAEIEADRAAGEARTEAPRVAPAAS